MKKRTGHLFQRIKGGTWFLRYMVEGRVKVESTGTTIRRDAEKERDRILERYRLADKVTRLQAITAELNKAESDVKELVNPPPGIKSAWNRFESSPERPDSGPATMKQYLSEWERFERWLTANRPAVERIDQVTFETAAAYAGDLTDAKLSASTFNQHRNLLRLVWRVLLPDAPNPWARIKPRRLAPLATRKRALTPAQFEALLSATEGDPDLHDLLLLLAWTGLRLVDGVKLKWGAVDFGQGVITLAPQKTARRTGKVVHIPMFPAVRAMLDARQSGAVLEPARYVFKTLADEYDRDNSGLSKRITSAFTSAGMQTTEERADRGRPVVVYGAHSLRHLFVTAATAAGMPAAMIKSITGHATDAMLEHYQQIGAGLAGEVAQHLSNGATKALAAPVVETMPGGMRGHLKAILADLDAGRITAARAALADMIEGATA
jgi:integrase